MPGNHGKVWKYSVVSSFCLRVVLILLAAIFVSQIDISYDLTKMVSSRDGPANCQIVMTEPVVAQYKLSVGGVDASSLQETKVCDVLTAQEVIQCIAALDLTRNGTLSSYQDGPVFVPRETLESPLDYPEDCQGKVVNNNSMLGLLMLILPSIILLKGIFTSWEWGGISWANLSSNKAWYLLLEFLKFFTATIMPGVALEWIVGMKSFGRSEFPGALVSEDSSWAIASVFTICMLGWLSIVHFIITQCEPSLTKKSRCAYVVWTPPCGSCCVISIFTISAWISYISLAFAINISFSLAFCLDLIQLIYLNVVLLDAVGTCTRVFGASDEMQNDAAETVGRAVAVCESRV
jgi:hypothetical protein